MSQKTPLVRSKLPITGRILMFFIHHLHHATASLGELWRNPLSSLMTMMVLGVSLSLPAALQVLAKNAEVIVQSWHSSADISLFIDPKHSKRTIKSLITRVKAYPEVARTRYINRDQALQEFQRLSGFGEALSYLDKNPLPAVIVVTPTSKYSTPAGAKKLLKKLKLEPKVSFARLDIEWLERLQALVQLVQHILFAITVLLILAVVLVIGNTIRLSIMNRRAEIEVMKLVGATERFIRRPFLYTGIWYGIIGGILAWIIINLLVWYLDGALATLLGLYGSNFEIQSLTMAELFQLVFMASALGWLGSYLSVRQHLRLIEPS